MKMKMLQYLRLSLHFIFSVFVCLSVHDKAPYLVYGVMDQSMQVDDLAEVDRSSLFR